MLASRSWPTAGALQFAIGVNFVHQSRHQRRKVGYPLAEELEGQTSVPLPGFPATTEFPVAASITQQDSKITSTSTITFSGDRFVLGKASLRILLINFCMLGTPGRLP
jgi:hypothetical protein